MGGDKGRYEGSWSRCPCFVTRQRGIYETGRDDEKQGSTLVRRPNRFDGELGRKGAQNLHDSARSWDLEKFRNRARVREAPGKPDVKRVLQAILMRFLALPRPLERIRSAQRAWLGPERISTAHHPGFSQEKRCGKGDLFRTFPLWKAIGKGTAKVLK